MINHPDFKPVQNILIDMARAHPDYPCLNFLGAKMTYGEVLDEARRAARGLQDMGVGPGTHVGLCLPNSPYYVIGYFATLMAGATVVNFNPLYTAEELSKQIEDSGVEVMFTLDMKTIYAKVSTALHKTSLRALIVCSLADALPPIKGLMMQAFKRAEIAVVATDLSHVPYRLLIADSGAPAAVTIDPGTGIAVIQYTGGTTGIPKGAMLSHANVSANAEQVCQRLGDAKPGEDRMLCVIPFFHVFAMTAGMNLGLSIGAELILLPRFDLDLVLETINNQRPTLFPAVPTIFGAINGHADLDDFDLSSIRYCISGGAPLPIDVKETFENKCGCAVVEGYGLSEASPVVACNPPLGENKPGSVGLPLQWTEVQVRDLVDPTRVLDQGEHGELVVRGPQVMVSYLNREDETNDAFSAGWLRTGDVGKIDQDGYIFITDRIKELIICSGFNVYPRVIEDALYRHADVAEAVVIGVPDAYRGEVPKAFVTLKPGGTVTEQDLMSFVHDILNPTERPAFVEIRAELPKTLIGKLSKKELTAEHVSTQERCHG